MTPHSQGFEDLLPSGGVPSSKREGSSSALPVGFQLAEFQIERVLGEGGFGIVYLALDRQLGRQVAIKEYMPNSLAGRQRDLHVTVRTDRYRETFELGRRSFINEARLLAHFDHPALVKVLRFWEDRGTAYMAMPFYQARTLKDVLRSMPPQPPEAWLRSLWDPMLDALAHLHTENCFHRDIAPDNILVLPSGLPLLIDFGAARQVIGDATQALTVILKPGFAPVEQYAESASMRQGAWTDIYALAAVMYHAISGKPPPPAVARLVHDEMVPAAQLGAGRYSAAFLHCIDVCLAVRPDHRPQRIAAVRALLQSAVPAAPPRAMLPDDDFLRDDDATVILPSAAGALAQPQPSRNSTPAAAAPVVGWQVPADQDDVTVTGPIPPQPSSLPRSAHPPYAAPPSVPVRSAESAGSVAASARPARPARPTPDFDRPFRPPGAPARSPLGKVLAGIALISVMAAVGWWSLGPAGEARRYAAAIEARAVSLLGLEPTGAGPGASAASARSAESAMSATTARGEPTPAPATASAASPDPAPTPTLATEVLAPPSLPASTAAQPAGLLPHAADAYAAFERIVASSDAAWPIQARLVRPTVALGQGVQLTIDSAVGGYVYVLQAVPGSKRVELLFPNRADTRNRIEPGASLALPRKGWRWLAAAPVGERRAVVVVTRSERRFKEALEHPAGLTPPGFDVSTLSTEPVHWPGTPDCSASDLACVGRYGAAVLDFAVAAAPKRVEQEPELEKIVIRRSGEAGPDDIPTPALSGNYPPAASPRTPADKAADASGQAIIERIIETPQRAPVAEPPQASDKPPEPPAPRARRMDECADLIRRAHSGSEDAAAAKEQLKDLRCE